MSDNAVAKSLKEKSKVEVINSAEAKWLNRKGILVAKFDFYRKQIYIEDIFVILHFDSPQHFACLHVNKLTSVYYDLLKSITGRPFNEYLDLRILVGIEIHEPNVWQEEAGCVCMVVLRYWHLFHGKPLL